MKSKSYKNIPKNKHVSTIAWLNVIFIFFLANFVINRTLQLHFFAQSCMSQAQINADNRCLYIYGVNIYEKGTRKSPHRKNPCASDVTGILPSNHSRNIARYLDPNLAGTLCTNIPMPTMTQRPTHTIAPPSQPTATHTPQPSATPTFKSPTQTPKIQPTQYVATSTPKPIAKAALPSPTENPDATGETNQSGFGAYISGGTPGSKPIAIADPLSQTAQPDTSYIEPRAQSFLSKFVWWSQILTIASFVVLLGSFLVTILRPRS